MEIEFTHSSETVDRIKKRAGLSYYNSIKGDSKSADPQEME